MKVFRVISEHCNDEGEIVSEHQFVTHVENNIVSVTRFMADECEQLEKDLKSVEEVLTVCHQIGK